MEHMLIVNLDPDMSPNAVEELKHAILMWRGVRGVEWQESRPTTRAADGANACPECGSEWNQFVCGQCGYYETPRR